MLDAGERIVGVVARDGDVAAVLVLFEDAEELREFGIALAEGDFDSATEREIACGVGSMDVEYVRSERLRGGAW